MAHFTCEVVYRGIFQKNLAARICRGIVAFRPQGGAVGHRLRALRRQPPAERHPGEGLRHRGRLAGGARAEHGPLRAQGGRRHHLRRRHPLEGRRVPGPGTGCSRSTRLTVSGGTVLMTSLQSPAPSSRTSTRRTRPTPWPSSGPRRPSRDSGSTRKTIPRPGSWARWPRSSPSSCRWTRSARPSRKPSGAPISRSPRPAKATSGWRASRSRSPRATRRSVLVREAEVVGDARGSDDPRDSHRQADGRGAKATCPSATRTSRSTRRAPCGRSSTSTSA